MSNKRYKCPYCSKRYERKNLSRHIEKEHGDILPLGYTPLRVAYDSINYGTIDHTAHCVICNAPTKWDEDKGRYDRLCGKKSCHDIYVKRFEDNMMRTNGVKRISSTVDGQEKMLAGRKISGRYRFKDGGVKTFTGSYEKDALMFMDQIMNCKSEDIMTPGPAMQYEYNGELHWYIPDILYIPYNLLIEVKDGGDKPNTLSMPEYRAKQIAKEKHVLDNTEYNYLRLTNKDCSQLLATMADLKMQLTEKTYERVININENMFAGIQGMMPMQNHKENDVYIVNYLQNNVFSGGEPDFLVSDSPTFDTVFYRDADGRLRRGKKDVLEDCAYNVYRVRDRKDIFEHNIYGHLNEFVDEGFIYSALFEKELYSPDQIKFEPMAEEVVDLYAYMEAVSDVIVNSAIPQSKLLNVPSQALGYNESVNIVSSADGSIYEESVTIPGLRANMNDPVERYIVKYIDHMKGGSING